MSLIALLQTEHVAMAGFNAMEGGQLYKELVGQLDCLLAVFIFALVLMLIFVFIL